MPRSRQGDGVWGEGIPEAPVTPLVLPADAAGVLIFGGTFDPPHVWHAKIASCVRDSLLGREGVIVVVPASRNPLKEGQPGANDPARAEMCRAMATGIGRCVVWTDELDRSRPAGGVAGGGASFTIDTIRRLHGLGVRGPVRLLLGADQAAQFHRWKEYESLMEQAEPAVVLRPPIDSAEKLRAALAVSGIWDSGAIDAWLLRVVVAPVAPLSSTAAREAIRRAWASESWGSLDATIDPGVLAIIRREGLYRA